MKYTLSHVWVMLIVLVGSAVGGELSGSLAYTDVHDRAAKAIAVPESGSHELRVITPTLLEVYIVSERDGFAKRPTFCDWVDDEADVIPGAIPVATDLEVTVDGTVTAVVATGFKRHVRFAPIGQSKFVMENFVYIELGSSIGTGATVAVTSPTAKWPSTFFLSAVMDEDRWNPAVHTNQVGYEIGARKTGHVGIWLGTLGEFAVNGAAGFEVINATTNAVAASGSLVVRSETGFQYPPTSGAPDPYLHVYEADFTSLDTPGVYRLKIPGIGASYPFEIGAGIDGVFARSFAAGLFHQRSGFDHQLPHTLYEDGPGHNALAEIPSNTDRAAYQFMWDWLQGETGGAITGPGDLLSPYTNTGTIDVIGGHHDAGDYSKYTTNVSQMVHALTFALDALPGVASLDNLGIPESGDGIADLLQEVKWEADFLAKLQDADGGFYYAVFPRDRRFDGNVLPSNGDVQIVLPKNIVATAAAVGALADTGSSPAFRAAYGAAVGDTYIAKALAGWGFLAATIDTNNDSNVTAAEIAAGYQKLSAYGDAFGPNDELAYAAAALFAATGNSAFEGFLKQLAPDPSSPALVTQGYIRLWEAWGSAFRSYAFATRTGRLATSQVDTAYLALVDAELVSAGDEIVARSNQSTYGIALDEKPKQFLNPSYVFGNDASFDALVAMQLNPGGSAGYTSAIRYNLNYTAGNNPANAPYLTGIGWAQRREIVSQFSQNDDFVLPPVGIPVGNVQAGMPYLGDYLTSGGGNLLQRSIFPNTGGFIYPVYDVWADTFEVRGETTVPPFARGAAVTAWLFAQSPLSSQAWNSATANISGVPELTPVGDSITATLASSIDLTGARITWEGSGIEPCHAGVTFTFTPTRSGDNHVAANILFPDGRR
ncbi:MAG: glycoside hydrolase family 9 protein, partial [Verrucomicrobiae bacterium]|nr:glycoside hydrolase family 9 protein [Verrucomicrobiae bacterium]